MTVKEYLNQAYLLDQRIHSYTIECDELREMAQSISSPGFEEHYNASKNTCAVSAYSGKAVGDGGMYLTRAGSSDKVEGSDS